MKISIEIETAENCYRLKMEAETPQDLEILDKLAGVVENGKTIRTFTTTVSVETPTMKRKFLIS